MSARSEPWRKKGNYIITTEIGRAGSRRGVKGSPRKKERGREGGSKVKMGSL